MGRKTALAAMLAARGTIQPIKALQQSLNAGSVPFAAECGWYLSRVQLSRHGGESIETPCLEFTNCWSQRLGFRIGGLVACLSIVGPAVDKGREQA
jgi:hypothetical protein